MTLTVPCAIPYAAMESYRDPYCDQDHNPRKRCNDALGPAPEPAAVFAVAAVEPTGAAAAASEREVAEPPASSAVREAVAIAEIPQPTPYATREWERTAAAVEAIAIDDEFDAEQEERASNPAMRLAIVALALVAAWIIARALSSRSRQ
jgi:hypothetical protein